MNNSLAKFITFEGIDGTGKSTQIKLLAEHLKEKHIEVIATREPGGCESAEMIREVIFKADTLPYTELLLFTAARIEHYFRVIKPSLEQGIFVLCDRYIDSTLIYQGMNNIPEKAVLNLHKDFIENKFPDITILLTANPELCLSRINSRKEASNKFDQGGIKYLTDLQNNFLNLAKNYSDRYVTIDASGDEEIVFTRILEKLKKLEII